MAVISDSNINSKIVSVGPFKLEFVWSNAAVSTGSFESNLQNPTIVAADTFNTASKVQYATVSGKTVTYDGLIGSAYSAFLIIGF
jgi:hypothetical protein